MPFLNTQVTTTPPIAVLIVDDDCVEATLIARAFQRCGFENPVRSVTSPEEAKKYLRGEAEYADRSRFPFPRLVFVDHGMPGTKDWETLRWIRNEPHLTTLPVIALTGSRDPKVHQEAVDLGANACHSKPDNSEEYEALIRRVGGFWLVGGQL